MSDRIAPIHKTPAEILEDLMAGHSEALIEGAERGKKYLLKYSERNKSIPNAVKFFLYDLLAEDAYQCDDLVTCRTAVARAVDYVEAAKDVRQFKEYRPMIRFYERGIALAIDDGELEVALALCDQAIALGLAKVYAAKRASIERMM
jgi:hypothetical protein